MPLDFPPSPSLNQQYSLGSRVWEWNGVAWVTVSYTTGGQGATGATGATGADGSALIPLATTGTTGVASFNDDFFTVSPTGHVLVKTGIKSGNLIVLGTSTIFGAGATGALPALDGSALTGVDANLLRGKTPRLLTDGGSF